MTAESRGIGFVGLPFPVAGNEEPGGLLMPVYPNIARPLRQDKGLLLSLGAERDLSG